MARKINVILVDDLDGTELTEDQAETVAFAIDGTAYELDLSGDNAAKFRGTFGQYMSVARRVGRAGDHTSSRRRSASGRSNVNRERANEIRQWAVAHGHMAEGSRGRIPGRVVELWEQATRGSQQSLPTPKVEAPKPTPEKSTAKPEKATTAKSEGKDTEKVPQPA
jgi:hypothetical protein